MRHMMTYGSVTPIADRRSLDFPLMRQRLRLLLIRHGRSAHVHSGSWLGREHLQRWREAYDRAGIADDDPPPPALVEEVKSAEVLVASDLPRAIASAGHLAFGRDVRTSALLREETLPLPGWVHVRLPLSAWEVLVHIRWFIDRSLRRDAGPEVLERARLASRWCHEVGREACLDPEKDATVAIVTHGVFRRILARQLVADGWHFEPGRLSYDNWSVWRLATD
jgi:broad specificity phosphatase PhoE